MSRIIEPQLTIYGSILIPPATILNAPTGYEFIKIVSGATGPVTIGTLLAVTGSNYISSSSNVVMNITGATANPSNLTISQSGEPLIGRWYSIGISGGTALAYIGK